MTLDPKTGELLTAGIRAELGKPGAGSVGTAKRPARKLVFTDIDGFRAYENERGDLINEHGDLLSIEHEANIRVALGQWKRTGLVYGGDR